MGDLTLICPLCCNKIFNSKEALVEHLATIIPNLYCPVCNSKVTSLEQLSEHLSVDNCTPVDTVQTIIFENTENNEYESENSTTLEYKPLDDDNSNADINNDFATHIEMVETGDINKMQLDLMKCLQTQELKLLKEEGENRYIIVTEHDTGSNQDEIVTKQRKDGTISFKSLKDIKDESDLAETTEMAKEDSTTLEQEYSCSTCEMSFTSVFDHITNYHNDQDVVVEGSIGNISSALPDVEYETVESEEPSRESQAPRRVITETGDIVETPLLVKVKTTPSEKTQLTQDTIVPKTNILGVSQYLDSWREVQMQPTSRSSTNLWSEGNVSDTTSSAVQAKPVKGQPAEKTGRGNKRYVQIDKLCDSVIRDLKQSDPKVGPCHKVVVAPSMLTTPEGESVKMFQCTSCNMFSSQLGDFRTQSCKAAKYSCSLCSVAYDNSKSLCAHMKVHKIKSEDVMPDFPETYECEICCTVFLTNKSLKLHKRMHEPIKSRPIDPPRNSISGEDRYQCSICEKMIPYDYRDIHKASHENDKMLNCGICNKKFSSADYLEMHMNVHNLDKAPQIKSNKSLPYSCIYCDRKFARPHEKVKHERIHTGEKPHECEICGKSFRVSYCLTLHMRTHTGARPYACPHCDKRFKAHSVYNHHLLTHSEVRAYKCPFCPKAFKTSVQLAGHKNSHTKPFSCTQCNRPFASLYAVRIHTETHSRQNNLKFRCSLCGASYARAFALKDHVKQVHKEDVDNLDPLTGKDWNKATADPDKDLTQEITALEIPTDEFIVPN